MQETVSVTGMILKTEPIGDYDRRLVILTGEKGKIVAFARGARRQGSRLLAASNPFCFGKFELFRGRNAYTIADVNIKNYFEGLRDDYEGSFYGMYFLEVMDYYTRENNDERRLMNLLYQTLKALGHPYLTNQLIRYIFEIKALAINGEYPGLPTERLTEWSGERPTKRLTERSGERPTERSNERKGDAALGNNWDEATRYTVEYIADSSIEKLYSFTVSPLVLGQLKVIADIYRHRFIDKPFKSLEILDTIR